VASEKYNKYVRIADSPRSTFPLNLRVLFEVVSLQFNRHGAYGELNCRLLLSFQIANRYVVSQGQVPFACTSPVCPARSRPSIPPELRESAVDQALKHSESD
jgi:hypothetical protein